MVKKSHGLLGIISMSVLPPGLSIRPFCSQFGNDFDHFPIERPPWIIHFMVLPHTTNKPKQTHQSIKNMPIYGHNNEHEIINLMRGVVRSKGD